MSLMTVNPFTYVMGIFTVVVSVWGCAGQYFRREHWLVLFAFIMGVMMLLKTGEIVYGVVSTRSSSNGSHSGTTSTGFGGTIWLLFSITILAFYTTSAVLALLIRREIMQGSKPKAAADATPAAGAQTKGYAHQVDE